MSALGARLERQSIMLPVVAGVLALTGSLAITLFLYRAAIDSFNRGLEERLAGRAELPKRVSGRERRDLRCRLR